MNDKMGNEVITQNDQGDGQRGTGPAGNTSDVDTFMNGVLDEDVARAWDAALSAYPAPPPARPTHRRAWFRIAAGYAVAAALLLGLFIENQSLRFELAAARQEWRPQVHSARESWIGTLPDRLSCCGEPVQRRSPEVVGSQRISNEDMDRVHSAPSNERRELADTLDDARQRYLTSLTTISTAHVSDGPERTRLTVLPLRVAGDPSAPVYSAFLLDAISALTDQKMKKDEKALLRTILSRLTLEERWRVLAIAAAVAPPSDAPLGVTLLVGNSQGPSEAENKRDKARLTLAVELPPQPRSIQRLLLASNEASLHAQSLTEEGYVDMPQ